MVAAFLFTSVIHFRRDNRNIDNVSANMRLTLFLAVQNLKLLPAFFDLGGELDCRQYNGMPQIVTLGNKTFLAVAEKRRERESCCGWKNNMKLMVIGSKSSPERADTLEKHTTLSIGSEPLFTLLLEAVW